MIILYDSKIKNKIQVSTRDLAISSFCLGEDVKTLRRFISRCEIITQKDVEAILRNTSLKFRFSKESITWDTGLIYYSPSKINWEAINILYVMWVSKVDEEALNRLYYFNEQKNATLLLYSQSVYQAQSDLAFHKANFFGQPLEYFNVKRFVRLAKRKKISCHQRDEKIILSFKGVTLQNSVGSITYNKIVIVIKDGKIDGFFLYFNDFDFSSYWNIPVLLHPFLAVPYGYNGHLGFLPPQSNSLFIESLVESVYKVPDEGATNSLSNIISDYQQLRKIWASNKEKFNDRLKLSKTILMKKQQYDMSSD